MSISFKNPPILEVSYSIQFEPINTLHIGYQGLIWNEFKDSFPNLEHGQKLSHEIERFGLPDLQPQNPFQLIDNVEAPRTLMVSENSERLIQIQNDRFVFNWRKFQNTDLSYPRYESLRKEYREWVTKFLHFLKKNEISGDLLLDQIEITNVNHIDVSDIAQNEIFNGLSCGSNISDSLELENYFFNMTHILKENDKPVGRLHTIAQKRMDNITKNPIYVVNLTARSNVNKGKTLDEILDDMDSLRNNINTVFKNITTPKMHKIWGLEENNHE